MLIATAHNATQVGYYKFTARTPAHLLAADKLITDLGFIRIPSFRIKPVGRASARAKPKSCRKK